MARVNDIAQTGSGFKEVLPMKAHGALAAGAVVWVAGDEDGYETLAVASGTTVQRAAVAQHAVASGDIGLFIVRGYAHATNLTSGSFTKGNGIETDGGNIEDSGTTAVVTQAEAVTDFAISMESGTTVTELDIFLIGAAFTSTT